MNTINKESVIFFDLDGTLYSYNKGHEAGLRGAYPYWQNLTGQTYEEFIDRYHKSRANVKRFLQMTVGSHSRALYFQGMIDDNFKTSQPLHIAELTQKYWDTFIDTIEPFEGVEEALDELRKNGHKLAIITNMSAEVQFRKLHKLKLDNFFEAIISSEEAGQEKPHPHIYLHAINRMKVKPQKCVMIGDDYRNDIEAAHYIGMKGIYIGIESKPPNDHVDKIESFHELVPTIERIKSEPLEGVIKYKLHHRKTNEFTGGTNLSELIHQRDSLWKLNLIGVYPPNHRLTPNVGFGNASQRYTSNGQFFVSGTQTGDLSETSEDKYSLVLDFNVETNEIFSKGPSKPSSESMTHAAIYEIAPEVNAVVHVHYEKMWKSYQKLGLLTTPQDVAYGTPAMANAVKDVYRENPELSAPVCMLGHTDGLIAWGKSHEEVLKIFTDALSKL